MNINRLNLSFQLIHTLGTLMTENHCLDIYFPAISNHSGASRCTQEFTCHFSKDSEKLREKFSPRRARSQWHKVNISIYFHPS